MRLKHIIRTVEKMRKKGTLPDLNVEIVNTPHGDIKELMPPEFRLTQEEYDKIDEEWMRLRTCMLLYFPIKFKNMNFGQAIEALKQGKSVAREGWNGKGMFLLLVNNIENDGFGCNDGGEPILLHDKLHPKMELLPWIGMKTVDNKFVPWLASQTDMLSEDWNVLN